MTPLEQKILAQKNVMSRLREELAVATAFHEGLTEAQEILERADRDKARAEHLAKKIDAELEKTRAENELEPMNQV